MNAKEFCSDEKLPPIEGVTVAQLLQRLRIGCLDGCDTVRVTLEPETCIKAGVPSPVSIFVISDADLIEAINRVLGIPV